MQVYPVRKRVNVEFPPIEILIENEEKYYKKLFDQVANRKDWKLPTEPAKVDAINRRDLLMNAIAFYAGGAEAIQVHENGKREFVVTSFGYYHYTNL